MAGATNVRVETSTSSPGSTPASSSAMCSAAVPLVVATAWSACALSASAVSKLSTKGPAEDTQVESTQEVT